MLKLQCIIRETLYMLSELQYKITGSFRYCSIIIARYQLSSKLKVILYTIFASLISLIIYGIYLTIPYYTLDQPLYGAVYSNDIREAKRLLKEGADPNKATWEDGVTTALQVAEANGNKDMVKLLIKYGAKD